jgi:hypothetical protein
MVRQVAPDRRNAFAYRKFGINWRVSDTAKAKSAKSTSILYLGFNYGSNKAAAAFIFPGREIPARCRPIRKRN